MRFSAALFTALSIQATVSAAWCPFCDAPSFTLSEQADQCAHILRGEWLGGKKPTAESAGTARFRILEIGQSDSDAFKVGSLIELPQYIAGKKDVSYILMGPGEKLIDWHPAKESTEDLWTYLDSVPAPVPASDEARQIKRLEFFIPYLQHKDPNIATDAYSEFAAAPYEVITPLAEKFPREKIQKWIVDPTTPVTRMGLFGLLLGLCGNEEDAKVMEQKILIPDSEFRMGIEGVMAGYLLIKGEDGLKVLETKKMLAKTFVNADGKEVKLPFSEVYATMQTLRFMWMYEPDRIPRQRLKTSMRNLLSRPEMADLVITDLSRWKDWDIQPQLMAMYDDENFDIASIKRAVIRYMFYCSRDVPKDGSAKPDYAIKAAENLEILRQKDEKTYNTVKRFLRTP